jgi:hypothetical protein
MPAGRLSRHWLCQTVVDDQGRLYLSDRSRYLYRELPDNQYHLVVEGDTLFLLAATYFEGVERPAGLFWVIADFQPTPIHDATLALENGRLLAIPSMRTLMEEILSPSRVDEFED